MDTQQSPKKLDGRPIVYDYESPSSFFRAMMIYKKSSCPDFSIRSATKKLNACSPSLVTQVLNEKRRLTRDQLPVFAQIFQLNNLEEEFLDNQIKIRTSTQERVLTAKSYQKRTPKNHILKDWLNVYVKDTCHLKNFKAEAKVIYRLLGGIANLDRISRSIEFLLKQGFWRINESKRVILEEAALVTTNQIPNIKIRQFHRRALQIARDGIEKYPTDRRFASTVLITVNRDTLDNLKTMINKFQKELLQFIEDNPDGKEQLYQVNINLTPIGGKFEDD